MSIPAGREQNWYPISKLGWFTSHIREGVAVTRRQLELLQPARARPYVLDDATVARIIRVHRDQAGDDGEVFALLQCLVPGDGFAPAGWAGQGGPRSSGASPVLDHQPTTHHRTPALRTDLLRILYRSSSQADMADLR